MKMIVKSLIVIIGNFVVFLLLSLCFSNLGSMLINIFALEFDFRDWCYENIQHHLFDYWFLTAGMSVCLYLIYSIACQWCTNIFRLLVAEVSGIILLIGLHTAYWKYIQYHCYGHMNSSLEWAFLESYGSHEKMAFYWTAYTCLVFGIGILFHSFTLFFQDHKRQILWKQVFHTNGLWKVLLYIAVPYGVIFSGTFWIVAILKVKVVKCFTVFVCIWVFWYLFKGIFQFIQIQNYYKEPESGTEEQKCKILIQESSETEGKFLLQLFESKMIKRMKEHGIYFYPHDLAKEEEVFIKLDVYAVEIFMETQAKKQQIYNDMTIKRGVFNLAYTLEDWETISNFYDGVFSSIEELESEILRLSGYIQFKENVNRELNRLAINKISKETCISSEIIGFKRYLEKQINEFPVFDFLIKWLENVNYLFTLIGISNNEIKISEDMKKKLEYADFGRWREIHQSIWEEDSKLRTIVEKYMFGEVAIQEFKSLWKNVVSREYTFVDPSVEMILDAANILRNYTRGHGVFTFEISQEINLKLIKILVELINCLMECLESADRLDNLEELGWLIYLGDTPYYLYDIDRNFEEFRFKSFQKSNMLSFPLDIHSNG